MKKKVSKILAEHFRHWGITDVFGVPGKAVCPLLFDLEAEDINFVLSSHEGGAGYEASGYALSKNTLGVAIGTTGPGGTNLLTAAGQAKAYHLPVLFITGHQPIQSTGKAQGQDSSSFGTDLTKMFEPVTLFSARVERSEMFPLYLRHAIEKAVTGKKGPVHLSIPYDVYMEEIESFYYPLPADIGTVISPDVDQVPSILNNAKKPVLFLGKGVGISNAYEEVGLVAEHWNIPVITTPCGKGAFPSVHPLSLGGFGLGGTEKSAEYLKSGIDVMIVVGTKLSDMSLAGFSADMHPDLILQFDCDLTFAGKSLPVPTKVLLGDAKANLKKLIEIAGCQPNPALAEVAATSSLAKEPSAGRDGMLTSEQAVKTLRSHLPKEAILFGDDGSHTFYAVRHYDIYQPGTFFFDDVFGAMGHAIGFSIGAKIASPEKPVVCLTGDGCTLMHGTEFITAKNNRVPVLFVVLNNGQLDMVDKGMSFSTGRSVGTTYQTPLNAAKFAEAMGVTSFRCHDEEELAEAIQSSLQADGPVVIEAIVDPAEVPPTLSRVVTLK
ncbi:thiamine pyrophosphate-binding protein [Bacillus sp. SG-1]|uniref:thiamine pyrophosphate-binding protein n=1 Tax=Bacillus sp. SG-1 TaxID=161544 RepID=UPI0001544548|nr:thiamine pyrophosphate-binding protein [Bacillus sp. SG-1]EDL64328.1 acetolactate synthase large subunit [Bacillus sp. SG-1]